MYRIIGEERDFLVISKSAGVHFHSQDGSPGLVAQLREDTGRALYPVHRLDTITSGVLLLAKSSEAAGNLNEQFSLHQVRKYYVALAKGKPKKKQGWIIGDMGKSRRSQYKLLRSKANPAVTQFFSQSVMSGIRLYLLRPLTGKTHQLRVALASLGTPILGDGLYGGENADRAYLHAWHLEFRYGGRDWSFKDDPVEGELYLRPEATALLAQWSPPSKLPWPQRKT